MKKGRIFFLTIIMVIVLVACGNNSTENMPTPNGNNESELSGMQNKMQTDDEATPTEPEKDSGTRTVDGPQVFAIYEENGGIHKEPFDFREDYPYFTKQGFEWKLDLNGNEIQLEEILTVNSVLTIVNGKLLTKSNAYIANENTLFIGDTKSDTGLVEIQVDETGIVNDASLYLHHLSMNVKSGTGIINHSALEKAYEESHLYELGQVMITVDGATGIVNEKACSLGAIQLYVNNGCGIENQTNGELFMFEYSEIYVNEGSGIINLGMITDDSHWKIVVNAGTGIDNLSRIQGYLDMTINDGAGLLNQKSGYYGGNESEPHFTVVMQQGTACINYGKMEYYNMTVRLSQGCAIDNYGILGGSHTIYGSNDKVYTGTVFYNREGASTGGISIYVNSAADSILVQNSGKFLEYEDWSVGMTIACGYHTPDEYEEPYPNQDALCENVILLQNSASTNLENGSLELMMSGKSTSSYIGLNCLENSTIQLLKEDGISLSIYAQNAIGILIPENSMICGNVTDSDEGYYYTAINFVIGMNEEARSVRFDIPEQFKMEEVTGNIAIKNMGTIKSCSFDYSIDSGQENVGLDNLGSCDTEITTVIVSGTNNIGLINYGSFTTRKSMSMSMGEGKDNIGLQNHKSFINHGAVGLSTSSSDSPENYSSETHKNLTVMQNYDYFQCDRSLSIGCNAIDSTFCINYGQMNAASIDLNGLGSNILSLLNDITGQITVSGDRETSTGEITVSVSAGSNIVNLYNKGLVSLDELIEIHNHAGDGSIGVVIDTGSSLHCRRMSITTYSDCIGLSCNGDIFIESDVNDEDAGRLVLSCYGGSCTNCLVNHGGTVRYKEIVEIPNM